MAGWSNKYTSLLRRHLSFFLHTLPFLFASIVLSLSLPSSLSTTTRPRRRPPASSCSATPPPHLPFPLLLLIAVRLVLPPT